MHLCRHVVELKKWLTGTLPEVKSPKSALRGGPLARFGANAGTRLGSDLRSREAFSAASSGVALVRNPRCRDRDKRAQIYKHNSGCKMLALPPAMQLCPQLAHVTVREKSKAFTSVAKAR